jgi:phosphatidylglycerol:prolipoprotein diacylglycerol transferase
MTFPVYLHIFGYRLHPHTVMEVIAYSAGFQLYRYLRPKFPRAAIPFEQNLWVFVGAIFGALIGSKVLAWVESMPDYWPHRFELATWMGGKTIVGGLLGSWAGVEIAKKFQGIKYSTGDVFVFPLILGQCIGRVGCFLTGLDDHTYGNFTSFPWAINFGDGPRHPTQLYEILFLVLLGGSLWFLRAGSQNRITAKERGREEDPAEPKDQNEVGILSRLRFFAVIRPANGTLFRLYLAAYLLFRFCIEFIKPTWKPNLGMSAIQWASLVGSALCIYGLTRRSPQHPAEWTRDDRVTPHAA